MKPLLVLCELLCPIFVLTQTNLKGTVLDEQSKPIAGASVTIALHNTSDVIAPDITHGNGNYAISLESNINELQDQNHFILSKTF